MKAVISSLLLTVTAVANAANCDVTDLTKISDTDDAVECKKKRCVLESLTEIKECFIDDVSLHGSIISPIDAVCSTDRALRAADGSHVHSSGMDMGSTTAEIEDSHDATSTSSEVYDSHDIASSTSASIVAGDDDDDDSHDTTNSKSTTSSTAGSKGTSNSTSSTPAPNASDASSAGPVTFAVGSVFLAAAAVFL